MTSFVSTMSVIQHLGKLVNELHLLGIALGRVSELPRLVALLGLSLSKVSECCESWAAHIIEAELEIGNKNPTEVNG